MCHLGPWHMCISIQPYTPMQSYVHVHGAFHFLIKKIFFLNQISYFILLPMSCLHLRSMHATSHRFPPLYPPFTLLVSRPTFLHLLPQSFVTSLFWGGTLACGPFSFDFLCIFGKNVGATISSSRLPLYKNCG